MWPWGPISETFKVDCVEERFEGECEGDMAEAKHLALPLYTIVSPFPKAFVGSKAMVFCRLHDGHSTDSRCHSLLSTVLTGGRSHPSPGPMSS